MAVYKIAATKANLQKAKSTLSFLRTGYDLLDKKRVVLIREQSLRKERERDLRVTIEQKWQIALKTLNYLFVTVGSNVVIRRAQAMPLDDGIEVVYHSLMGVAVAELERKEEEETLEAIQMDPAFAHAISAVQELKARLLEYVAAKAAVDRLQREIEKTQKRANALDKVQIPKYEQIVYNIEQILEEKEREEFFRLKLVKKGHGKTRKADRSGDEQKRKSST